MSECRDTESLFQDAKEEAQREAYAFPTPNGRRPLRPFNILVTGQLDKNRRDRSYRERLLKERRQEQQKHERREHDIDRAMHPVRPNSGGKHQRGKRSMGGVSLFFRAVRPLSTAWGSERATSRPRTASELDFPANGRPSLVLSLNDARAHVLASDERPYVFLLSTEDGGRWLLQTTNSSELESWTNAINVASRKRSTYIPSTKPAQPDSLPPIGRSGGAGMIKEFLPSRMVSLMRT